MAAKKACRSAANSDDTMVDSREQRKVVMMVSLRVGLWGVLKAAMSVVNSAIQRVESTESHLAGSWAYLTVDLMAQPKAVQWVNPTAALTARCLAVQKAVDLEPQSAGPKAKRWVDSWVSSRAALTAVLWVATKDNLTADCLAGQMAQKWAESSACLRVAMLACRWAACSAALKAGQMATPTGGQTVDQKVVRREVKTVDK